MNEQLAKALGINFIEKRTRVSSSCDVKITRSDSKFYNGYLFSFSDKFAKKLGDRVRVAVTDKRIYFVSGCDDEYGYKLMRQKSKSNTRAYIRLPVSSVGFIDKFLGSHSVAYYEDLDAYYVGAKGASK